MSRPSSVKAPKGATKRVAGDTVVPPAHVWKTTDDEELARRRQRARDEQFVITNTDARHPIHSNFRVQSRSGLVYSVEIRDVAGRQFACECVDFRINGLGSCKHVEAALNLLEARHRRLFRQAVQAGSTRLDLVPDAAAGALRLIGDPARLAALPRSVAGFFDDDGRLRAGSPEEATEALEKIRAAGPPGLRISQEVAPWLEARRQATEAVELRREYELKVQRGEWPAHETLVPLFPYQREGMLHLAFKGRALLADEMGLGKTIQAIAACALLHRLGQARRVLVVTPASLKTEWEEQIRRFTPLPLRLVFGGRAIRRQAYVAADAPFFTIVNYEQMRADALEVNARLRPDVVVLDEAQRIKNWNAKTTQAIKRLRSRYAFVLTGTPIENRIDELHSLMDFLDPRVLGPLFRFNRDFYEFDERGRPSGYRNLGQLNARVAPFMLRRRKADVETELPARTDRTHFVALSPEQKVAYAEHHDVVARLASAAKRRPLTQREQERLMIHLAMMRMVCDSNYILDPKSRACPKLVELEKLLEEIRDSGDAKVIIFSEWERMLELVREVTRKLKLGAAWHTGSVPQQKRRAEINAFKQDPGCRVFLSTDAGATGLNLQAASVVINCDLPWNPARLEQRIARAWRKHQTLAVTVINLVSQDTIEHRMLETLANKQALSDGVLDLRGDLAQIKLRSGRQAFLAKLEQLVTQPADRPPSSSNGVSSGSQSDPAGSSPRRVLPADRPLAFAQLVSERIGPNLVRCEERFPQMGEHTVLCVVVEREPALVRPVLEALQADLFTAAAGVPLRSSQLVVLDRATDETLQRLIAAGVIATTTRATRPLFPAADTMPLTAEEQARVAGHRALAGRKVKMARLLSDGGLGEEAATPLREALLAWAQALALEHRLPAPVDLEAALAPSFAGRWGEAFASLRPFAEAEPESFAPALAALGALLSAT